MAFTFRHTTPPSCYDMDPAMARALVPKHWEDWPVALLWAANFPLNSLTLLQGLLDRSLVVSGTVMS